MTRNRASYTSVQQVCPESIRMNLLLELKRVKCKRHALGSIRRYLKCVALRVARVLCKSCSSKPRSIPLHSACLFHRGSLFLLSKDAPNASPHAGRNARVMDHSPIAVSLKYLQERRSRSKLRCQRDGVIVPSVPAFQCPPPAINMCTRGTTSSNTRQ